MRLLWILCFIVPFAAQAEGLRSFAERIGFAVGAAVDFESEPGPPESDLLAREYNLLTPENSMKWKWIEPELGVFDFQRSDRVVEFAARNGQKVRGHTLLWHESNPDWLTKGQFTGADLAVILENHIRTVIHHFREKRPGTVVTWDVVNEAIDDQGRLRSTLWSTLGGTKDPEAFVRLAFQTARRADPSARLCYNDYGNDGSNSVKTEAVFRFVERHKAKGVPIDCVGFQMHLGPATGAMVVPDRLRNLFRRYRAIGVVVEVTEFDFGIPQRPTPADLSLQNRVYREALSACLHSPNCRSFVTWGYTDAKSWIPSWFPGFGHALPFDEALRPKGAYQSLREELSARALRN